MRHRTAPSAQKCAIACEICEIALLAERCVHNLPVQPANEAIPINERYYTAEEIAHALKLHVETIRKWFRHREGVLRFGSEATAEKRQRLIIRIPASVLECALRERTLMEADKRRGSHRLGTGRAPSQ
jgi:hypothetical protein